jgi:hypothetical protein
MLRKTKAAGYACLFAFFLTAQRGDALGQLFGHRRPTPASAPGRADVELPEVSGLDGLPDPVRTAVPSIPLPPSGLPRLPRIYRGLDAEQCAGLAASNSEEAAVIDSRRLAVMAELPKHGTDPSRQMLIKGLWYEASEVRNQDTCKALTLFYRLAQAQLQEEVLRRSQLEISEALQGSKEQVDRGLMPGREAYDALRIRQLDLVAKQVELAGTIDRLNVLLKNLLAAAQSDCDWFVRPLVDWESIGPAPDASESVAVGLAQSPQLLMLRTVAAEVNQKSQAAVEQFLASVSPLAGSTGRVGPAPGLATIVQALKRSRDRKESVEALRARARQTLAWRERTLEADIRSAILNVETGLQEIAVARNHHALRAEELQRLVKKSDRGLTAGLEVSTARLELLKSQGRWVDLVGELEVRRVEVFRLMSRYAGSSDPGSPPPLAAR